MINAKKNIFDTLNHDHKGLGVDRDFSSTTNPQELYNRKSRPPKIEKKKIEKEREITFCVRENYAQKVREHWKFIVRR